MNDALDKNLERQPWVTIVLTCYNQVAFVEDALWSVHLQTHASVELIVVDNGSTDGSEEIIKQFICVHPAIQLIRNHDNLGLCKAFNQGLKLAKGHYIIDFSGDDVMLPERVASQVAFFLTLPTHAAVVYGNALLIDEKSRHIGLHDAVDGMGKSKAKAPSGLIYDKILARYFICAPTMMMRTDILRQLGGYDEDLVFEDFDLWVRTSRHYPYYYQNDILTLVRKHRNSLSQKVLEKDNAILKSTLLVCRKAYVLNRTSNEHHLLAVRIRSFIRKCWYSHSYDLAEEFRILLNETEKTGWFTKIFVVFCRLRLPINGVYRILCRFINFRSPYWIDFARSIVTNKNQNVYVRRIYSNISRKPR